MTVDVPMFFSAPATVLWGSSAKLKEKWQHFLFEKHIENGNNLLDMKKYNIMNNKMVKILRNLVCRETSNFKEHYTVSK